ncbi:hypothetical protein [Pseudonocardia sp. GCM10023141]|uniref:hypothetical protein n=1 Tax=Pseudonocardia sp. GCM10023141 TaxID=3252653 RepID=UPI00361D4519
MGVRGRLAALVVIVGVVLAGCDDPRVAATSGGGGTPAVSTSVAKVTPPGCSAATGRAGSRLPTFDRATARTDIAVKANPCFDPVGLAAEALGIVPPNWRAKMPAYVDRIERIAGNLATINDVVKCGYENDRLAIGIYHQPKWVYSVGMVAVVRGTSGAAIDALQCYLESLLGFDAPPTQPRGAPAQPSIQPCAGYRAEESAVDGQFYTVLWAGSTDWMCTALTAKLQR